MGFDDDEEKADLVAKIKRLQRDSEEGKQQWWAFCDAEGFSNRRDPNRHATDFLRRFFDARRDGGIPQGRPPAPPHDADPEHRMWVGRVKQVQRSEPDTKAKWERYCELHGNGIRDPQRHDSMYLRRFIEEFLPRDGMMGGGCGPPGFPPMGGGFMPPPQGGFPPQGFPSFGDFPPIPVGAAPPPPPGLPGLPWVAPSGGYPAPWLASKLGSRRRSRSRRRRSRSLSESL